MAESLQTTSALPISQLPVNSSSAGVTTHTIRLRPPTTTSLPQPSTFVPPTLRALEGTWQVTHSTLPMWKEKRNVRITYSILPPSHTSPSELSRLDDLVSYQTSTSDTFKTIHGISKPSSSGGRSAEQGQDARCGEFNWRGKGWLAIASSHWEILGWGMEGGLGEPLSKTERGRVDAQVDDEVDEDISWAVTYFAKTLFTPAGIDIYARNPKDLSSEILQGIKRGLAEMEDEGVRRLAGQLFEIKRDDGRKSVDL